MTSLPLSSCKNTEKCSCSSKIITKAVKPPEIVRYAFEDFLVDGKKNKWKAKCCTCKEYISETRGITTGFSTYVILT